jgi:hypothetical protein
MARSKNLTVEDIVTHCRKLRLAFEKDEAKFFLGLVSVERQHMTFLRGNGCGTFMSFIKTYQFCEPARYSAFVKGLEHLKSDSEAERIGAPAVIALAQTVDAQNVTKYTQAIDAFRYEHQGLTPRLEQAKKILRQVDPRPEVPRNVTLLAVRAKLEAENAQLKADLRMAQKKIRELEAEIARLKNGRRSKGGQAPDKTIHPD